MAANPPVMEDRKEDFKTVLLPALAVADMYRSHLVLLPHEVAPSQPVAPAIPAKPVATASPPQQTPAPPAPAAPAAPAATTATAPTPPPAKPTAAPQPATTPASPAALTWLGRFEKKVLVIVHEPEAVHCSEEQLGFLTKILAAVGLGMADVAIVNAARHQLAYPALKAQLPASSAIYFGLEPFSVGVPMRIPYFQVQQWDSCQFLYAPALPDLNGNSPAQVEQKKLLWAALKKMFR
jgi:hypothetical protein